MDKIKFANGNSYEILEGASLGNVVMTSADPDEIFADLTDSTNLESVQFIEVTDESETVYGDYTYLTLINPVYHVNTDKNIVVALREMTDVEKSIYNLEASQEIQDGAIADLAEEIGG